MSITVSEVAALVGGEVCGDGAASLTGLNAFDLASEGQLTFAGSKSYLERIDETRAACVLVPADYDASAEKTVVKVKDPKNAFVLVLARLYIPEKAKPGVHPSAVVGKGVELGDAVSVGANAVIEDEAVIGDGVTIGAGATIGKRTQVGARTIIHANVTIYRDITLGADVIIHSGAVIGADGFGYVEHEGELHKVPQTGTVQIGNSVEIGANATIDRATFGATVIHDHAKIDNLCQIGHNVELGRNVRVAALSGIGGSTKVGDNAMLAAQSGLRDNITIGEGAIVLAKTGVSNDVKPGEVVFGIPARKQADAFKEIAATRRLAPHAKTLVRMAREHEKQTGA